VETDYLIVGSGLSALVFGALMAKSGKKVHLLEVHEFPGGFGHTFTMANKYHFNAQLHYVWDCGEGQPVYQILKKLGLDKIVTFERYDPSGFDHMRMPNYALDIPSDTQELIQRLSLLFPQDAAAIREFICEVEQVSLGLKYLVPPIALLPVIQHIVPAFSAAQYFNATLQDVFDKFNLPIEAQTLLALQWPDFLLPPNQLSFYAWVILFTSYQKGAFYPTQHFEHVVNALVKVIEDAGGKVQYNAEVTDFIQTGKQIIGVIAKDRINQQTYELKGKAVICNIDPKRAAQMIGIENFSADVQKKLNYTYSPSNFVAYCVVKDIDLRDFGFGKWNTFYTGEQDLNEAFVRMYENHDYTNPSFAITTPTLLTEASRDCPVDHQIVEFLTVADYSYFKKLRESDAKSYRQKKEEILDVMIDIVEKHYVPDFRKHLVFKITGSPTTNEHFCWCPEGNSYGSSLTPQNVGIGRLNYLSSLDNFYFCNASSGFPGFAPSFWTGARLYQYLSGDTELSHDAKGDYS
jgi:all-trans-retinol 13,14-reductase